MGITPELVDEPDSAEDLGGFAHQASEFEILSI